jgi:hypothetical protein
MGFGAQARQVQAGGGITPRGYASTFTGLPHLICVNKPLAQSSGVVPKGTVAVTCYTNLSSAASPLPNSDYVVFEFNRLSVYSPTDQLVFRART